MHVKVHILQLGSLQTNCYLLSEATSGLTLCIDPGAEPETIRSFAEQQQLTVTCIALTHGHGDHIGAVATLKQRWQVPVRIHEQDAGMLGCSQQNLSAFVGQHITAPNADAFLRDGEQVTVGAMTVRVLHTPGHTPGGVCLFVPDGDDTPLLFSGDTLFNHEVGRCDLPGGSLDTLKQSVRDKLYCLPDETVVYPGHGPATTIAVEKAENPYVRLKA